MVDETTKEVLKAIHKLHKEGILYIDRLKDPHSDCLVDITIGNGTFLDCKELVLHYRDKNDMLAYTTIELIVKDNAYYYLEIRDYTKGKTLHTQQPLHTIVKRNSCTTTTARSW